jgi:DNA-binding response OmpR family regulator
VHRSLQKIYHNGIQVNVRKAEFDISLFLAQNPGKNISIGLLTNILSEWDTSVNEIQVRNSVDDVMTKIGENVISEKSLKLFNFDYRPNVSPL